jgi:transglutaminase-like putative cysteine protease
MTATARPPALEPAAFEPRRRPQPRRQRGGGLTLFAFALLCGYGVVRWATMLAAPPTGRFAGLIACACAVALLGGATRTPDRRVRLAANVAIVVAGIAMLPISGLPLSWLLELRIGSLGRAISDGVSQLPGVVVPYRGSDPWTRAVIVLGAGVLMLGGALMLASPRPQPGGSDRFRAPAGPALTGRSDDARLICAALPLIVLVIVPSALARPQFAWLHGAVTFLLLALFVFSERVPPGRALGASACVAVAAVAALLISPALGVRRPWVNVTTLASRLDAGDARFNWTQSYGPLAWPQTAHTALTVDAAFPYYWKAENLDEFNGRGWVDAPLGLSSGVAAIAPSNLERWTQTLTVTLDGITTSQVIAAGLADAPTLAGDVTGGASPGTYVTDEPLTPGDRYTVVVYTPEPTPAELVSAGVAYPLAAIGSDLTLELPTGGDRQPQIRFAAYGSGAGVEAIAGESAAQETAALQRSVYGRAYALAQRLKAGTATPYQYVLAIERYLANGYHYDQRPPPADYPLIAFLFGSKRGYCQQFAGAMALLLRMGGVPARVAVGFTTGQRSSAAGTYVVSDLDAHAWVEAWFPSYGWVRFDPTPDADPALGGSVPGAGAASGELTLPPATATGFGDHRSDGAANAVRHHRRHGSPGSSAALAVILAIAAVGALTLIALVAFSRRRRRARGVDRVDELERALRRCRTEVGDGVTLAMLERRFADAPQAAEYIRRIRRARFAGGGAGPTRTQRRALRRRLARGRGLAGWLRALIALPPARARRD